MTAYYKDTRSDLRLKCEVVVGLKFEGVVSIAYTIDLSRNGVKIGRPQLFLTVGACVEVLIERHGVKHPFAGRVARNDGGYYLNRVNSSVPAYFIAISDETYADFVGRNYFL